MRKYVGLEVFDDVQPAQIKMINCDGLIAGDPFCQYRMFRDGTPGMIELIRTVCEYGKEVIYQTPVYCTNRNMMEVQKNIAFLYSRYNVKKYLVQDIGLTDWIVNHFSDAEIIWSRWGKNRNSLTNHAFAEFLSSLGVTAVETSKPERMSALSKMGLKVFAEYGNTLYNTVSRDCYNTYMLNRYDGICSRECINEEMVLTNGNMHMTVNGHILGKKLSYMDVEIFCNAAAHDATGIILYASDFMAAEKILQAINEKEPLK